VKLRKADWNFEPDGVFASIATLFMQAGCVEVRRVGASVMCVLPSLAAADAAVAAAQARVAALVSRTLAAAAHTFMQSYSGMARFLDALATLDVLAGFAVATLPEAAPPGNGRGRVAHDHLTTTASQPSALPFTTLPCLMVATWCNGEDDHALPLPPRLPLLSTLPVGPAHHHNR
jgi:hypothetical protein